MVPGCFTISGFKLTEELGIVGDCVEFRPLSSYRDHHSSFCEVARVVFGWLRTLQVEQTHLGFLNAACPTDPQARSAGQFLKDIERVHGRNRAAS
jgi:hypothetical protein